MTIKLINGNVCFFFPLSMYFCFFFRFQSFLTSIFIIGKNQFAIIFIFVDGKDNFLWEKCYNFRSGEVFFESENGIFRRTKALGASGLRCWHFQTFSSCASKLAYSEYLELIVVTWRCFERPELILKIRKHKSFPRKSDPSKNNQQCNLRVAKAFSMGSPG